MGPLVLPLSFVLRDLIHKQSPSHLLVLGLTVVGLIVVFKLALVQTVFRRLR